MIPGVDIIEDAESLSLPYFSIIEIPIKKYPLVKKDNEAKELK